MSAAKFDPLITFHSLLNIQHQITSILPFINSKFNENLQNTFNKESDSTPLISAPRQAKREFAYEDNNRKLVFTPEEIMTARKMRFLDMLVGGAGEEKSYSTN